MKIALCCIGKLENKYIREFVEHYRNVGFDKIFLYDNNNIEGERFEDVINDYIECGFVDVINFRGKEICQLEAYESCYQLHKNEYDWIAFFDCDEFVELVEDDNIKSYLSRDIFSTYDMIHVNWMCYGDNDLVGNESDNYSLKERFKEPLPLNFRGYDFFYKGDDNDHIKTILRGGLDNVSWIKSWNPHTPMSYKRCCDNKGTVCQQNTPFWKYDFTLCYLKHYCTKTITEWMDKINRGYCDQDEKTAKKNITLDRFFRVNKLTNEKIKVIHDYCNNKQ